MIAQMERQNYIRKHYKEHNKSELINELFKVIKKKKVDLEKEIKQYDQKNCSLPIIAPEPYRSLKEQEDQEIPQIEDSIEKNSRIFERSPPAIFKPVFEDKQTLTNIRTFQNSKNNIESPRFRINTKNKDQKQYSNRIKSEHHEPQLKITVNTEIDQENSLEKQQVTYALNLQQAKQQFIASIEKVPKAVKSRTEAVLLEPIKYLQIFNPFFNRNHRIVNFCLLKIGKIVYKDSSPLYKLGDQISSFYIILSGRVKLTNGNLKRICERGETVLEEVLFCGKLKKIALERAKTIGSTYLLQIGANQFKHVKQQMIRHRFKVQTQEMEAVIKRNYIVKNWLRNKARAEKDI